MAAIRFKINGQDYGYPRNWQDLEITSNFLGKQSSGTINVSELSFIGAANAYLQRRAQDGNTGGVGIFEAEPCTIEVGNPDAPEFVFEGMLDFSENMTIFGREEITVALKKRKGDDWINDVADSFSMAFLRDQGFIKNSDYVRVPYVINHIPDGVQLMVLSMSVYMMTKEIIENVSAISEAIAQLIKSAVPSVGTGVGAAAGTPPAPVVTADTTFNLGEFIYSALKILARIIYTIAVVYAITKLIEQIFEQLFPKKRYHLGIKVTTLFEKSCEKLGLQFDNNIIPKDWVYIPRKDRKGGESGEKGYPDNGSEIYLFGDLIRVFQEMLCADYRITGNKFRFDREDSFYEPSPYNLPSFFTNQDRKLDAFRYNTDQMVANYNIAFQYDVQDQNTLDDQTGRVFQAVTEPITKNDADLVMVKNLTEIDLPFSLGKTKNSLTNVEESLSVLANIVDGLTAIFGGGTNFKGKIDARRGSLLLSSHFLTVGKLVSMKGSQLAADQRQEISAEKLWEDFHFIRSFAPYNGVHNQHKVYKESPVPMSIGEYVTILNNNRCHDGQGREFVIDKVVYKPAFQTAKIDYRIKHKYTNNLKIKTII